MGVSNFSSVTLELQNVELPETATATACRNDHCVTLAVGATILDDVPSHRVSTRGSDYVLGYLDVERTKTGLKVWYNIGTPGVDGDIYSFRLELPNGTIVFDRSIAVDYDFHEATQCSDQYWIARVVLD